MAALCELRDLHPCATGLGLRISLLALVQLEVFARILIVSRLQLTKWLNLHDQVL